MLVFRIVLAAGLLSLLGWGPRSRSTTVVVAGGALFELVLGGAPVHTVRLAVAETMPLGVFLTAAIWLAVLAEQVGLAARFAAALARAAHGRKPVLYVLVCVLCAVLTATVSLDGAVVLMVPVLSALTQRAKELVRPLLLGTVGVANAFSFAVPQGNPTNLVVMGRLGLSPETFVAHLLVPAVLATLVCVCALAVAERAALHGRFEAGDPPLRSFSKPERLAAGALGAAALACAAAPWLGIAPWWALCSVAGVTFAAAHALRAPVPGLPLPWRVFIQVATLVVIFDSLSGALHLPTLTTASFVALLALALVAAVAASMVNNLPASVALATVLGSRGPTAYAALAGLSAGALATPHGSVATLIAFDRAGRRAADPCADGYIKLWLPTTAIALAAATAGVWFA